MKLSDFKGADGVKAAARLIDPVMKIVSNESVRKMRKDRERNGNEKPLTVMELVSAMIENEPEAAMEMYAILNDVDTDEYKKSCTAATVVDDIFGMIADDDLMSLFGLRAKKTEKTSSSSASENTEA